MWIVCVVLSLFSIGMFYWNSVLRSYATQSRSWFEQVYDDVSQDDTWKLESAIIRERSIRTAEDVEWRTDARFLPYSLIMILTVIMTMLHFMEVQVPILKYVVILGTAYLGSSIRTSYVNYQILRAEVDTINVVLTAKIYYDEQQLTEAIDDVE